MRRAAVAQCVRVQVGPARAQHAVAPHDVLHLAHGQACAVAAEEQRRRVLRARTRMAQQRAQAEIALERARARLAKRYEAFFAALAEHARQTRWELEPIEV